MKDIYYKASDGTILNLIEKPYRMLSDTDLFNYEWKEETTGQNFPHIVAFKNQMVSKSIKLRVTGTDENDLMNNIEHLVEMVDADLRNQTFGRIYYGDYFVECFVNASDKQKFLAKDSTIITLTLIAESGEWKQEKPQIYSGLSGDERVNNSSFPSVSSSVEWEYSINDDDTTTVRWESLNSSPEDIALDQDADSPEYSPSHTPAMAVDGDYSTYFEIPANATDKSLVITFDKVYHAKNFILQHPQGITGDVRLYDYSTGERGFYFGKFTGSDPMTIDIEPSDVSAVEVVFESTNAVTIVEFVIYEDEQLDPQPTLTIDLGAVIDIATIGPLPATLLDSGTLDVSEDGETWNTLDSSGSGSHTFYWHNANGESVRYIRLTSTRKIVVESNAFEILQHIEETYEVNVARLSSDTTEGDARVQIAGVQKQMLIGFDYVDYGKVVMDFQNRYDITKLSDPAYTVEDFKGIHYQVRSGSISNVKIYAGVSLDNLTQLEYQTVSGETQGTGYIYWEGNIEARYFVFEVTDGVTLVCNDLEIIAEDSDIPLLNILNDNYVSSDALIKIYGPTLSPSVSIGESSYGIENYSLNADEYLEIDTVKKTLRVYDENDGSFVNVFPYRLLQTFDRVGVGLNALIWVGNLTVEITLKKNRSEPKWT